MQFTPWRRGAALQPQNGHTLGLAGLRLPRRSPSAVFHAPCPGEKRLARVVEWLTGCGSWLVESWFRDLDHGINMLFC